MVSFDAEEVMERALDVGEAILCTGGEISRVEDTIMRICFAYGGGVVDVFTILSLIILSWRTEDGKHYTQTRRIYSYENNLAKLEELNALSRYICQKKPDFDDIDIRLDHILNRPEKKIGKSILAGYCLGAGGFAVFFGGTTRDGIAAGLVGSILFFWELFYKKFSGNRVVYTLITSFLVGILCILSVFCGLGQNTDKVMIGAIMLLIPGIALMNALRDMICGDIITGALKMIESLMIAAAIAGGFAIALILSNHLGAVLF